MQYWTCPLCSSNLDHGEKCDCREEKREEDESYAKKIRVFPETDQYSFVFEDMEDGYEKASSY